MKNLSSWLITIFIIMFWGFRVLVATNAASGGEFVTTPIDITAEIVLLFVVLALVPFIFKRKLLAGLIYLGAYGWYFGRGLVTNVIAMINGQTLSQDTYLDMFIALIAITLAFAATIDILLDKTRLKNPSDKKTDWFYKNKEYERKLDERADKNNYKIY